MKDIIYICEITADLDDMIAVRYLQNENRLRGIIFDPEPKTKDDWSRVNKLKELGIEILKSIPSDTDYVFIGGAFTKLSSYLINHKLVTIVANGGFVGNNIVPDQIALNKFKSKKYCKTFNFNMDPESAYKVLTSPNVQNILLVGKNVCHDPRNSCIGIWKDHPAKDWILEYNGRINQKQHDMLACHQGLLFIDNLFSNISSYQYYIEWLVYNRITPVVKDNKFNGKYTEWGSEENPTSNILSAIGWSKDILSK